MPRPRDSVLTANTSHLPASIKHLVSTSTGLLACSCVAECCWTGGKCVCAECDCARYAGTPSRPSLHTFMSCFGMLPTTLAMEGLLTRDDPDLIPSSLPNYAIADPEWRIRQARSVAECPPGVHSIFDFCPGDCTVFDDEETLCPGGSTDTAPDEA